MVYAAVHEFNIKIIILCESHAIILNRKWSAIRTFMFHDGLMAFREKLNLN